jgi:hypothetical protein
VGEEKEFKEYTLPDIIPHMRPVARTARMLADLTKRFTKDAKQLLVDYEYNCDDIDYYKFSAFFANVGGSVENAEEALEFANEFWPEDRKR